MNCRELKVKISPLMDKFKKLIEIYPRDYIFLVILYPIAMCFVLFGLSWKEVLITFTIDTVAFFIFVKPANYVFFKMYPKLVSLDNTSETVKKIKNDFPAQQDFFNQLSKFPEQRCLFVFLFSFFKVTPAGIYIALRSQTSSFTGNMVLFYLAEIFVLGYFSTLLFLELHKISFAIMNELKDTDGWKDNYRQLKLGISQERFAAIMNFIVISMLLNLGIILTINSYMQTSENLIPLGIFVLISIACIAFVQLVYQRYFSSSLKTMVSKLSELEVMPMHTTPLLAGFDHAFNQLGQKVAQREKEIIQWMNHETGQSHFRTLGEMTALVAHDLKNPLNVMRMCIDLINRPGITDEERNRLIKMLDRNLDQSLKLTQTIMSYSRGSKETEYCTFEDINQNLLELFSIQFFNDDFTKVKIEVAEDLKATTIMVNRLDLMHIFYNLYDNAIKSTFRSGTPRPMINVWVEKLDHTISIFIKDNGQGLAEEEFKQLVTFDRFNESGSFYKGLGIKLTNALIKNIGGELDLIPSEKGTCMKVTFKNLPS